MFPILIAGAGIGGLTAAIALARRGIPVAIAEKRTRFAEAGAGIQISPNAGRVLEALDLGIALRRVAVRPEALAISRWQGEAPLLRMPYAPPAPGATPSRALKRADLHQILLDAARTLPNIRWLIGRGLLDCTETAAGLTVTLASESGQTETIEAMGLIGADGLWSRARELTGDARPPRFTGWEAWRTLIPSAEVPSELRQPTISLRLGSARHAVHYPVSAGKEINLVLIRAAREARPGWSRDGDARDLTGIASGAPIALRHLIEAAPAWQVWSLYDREPAAMAKGRIALLGDAAHPVLPFLAQGAALAIEDAAVLAHELASGLQAGGTASVPAAFAAYAAARQARATRVQQASRDNARSYHLGRPWSFARDLVLRRLGPEGLRQRYAWVYDWPLPG
ncbi:MAG: FAD-dependent monooxygenase [Bosea sp.]|uniref:FAD-dependent monooxygenase n=1 Tax=Bosea sp. (in: a-proteobacteria) TaxID=1871050 RepID=UPI001AD0B407|nr:FAD-dependent monooxygenase [Bosea sp. (in: a-proteobacteria)]MBN9470258.1 FAD-dependent monooxygenase [Bosea sp. (in: a-proteobacteria)]